MVTAALATAGIDKSTASSASGRVSIVPAPELQRRPRPLFSVKLPFNSHTLINSCAVAHRSRPHDGKAILGRRWSEQARDTSSMPTLIAQGQLPKCWHSARRDPGCSQPLAGASPSNYELPPLDWQNRRTMRMNGLKRAFFIVALAI